MRHTPHILSSASPESLNGQVKSNFDPIPDGFNASPLLEPKLCGYSDHTVEVNISPDRLAVDFPVLFFCFVLMEISMNCKPSLPIIGLTPLWQVEAFLTWWTLLFLKVEFSPVDHIVTNTPLQRPGGSPKELLNIIHEKLPTALIATISILLSTYAKILRHCQPPDLELQNQIWAIFKKYESSIEVEIQQRALKYFSLSRKVVDLMDILAEIPKFPERQSALIKKVEDIEVDTSETSAIKLRA
ncbi:hypothetical protein KIW84_054680 [Lathyrus oleraceus]|uniref:Uncharacterized protein n=1 Tax=Pisum sativum TaxID=3888 RepID=A0A9D4WUW4_PEA|nr:hypothetical protein KIW84_054680 [Pisum sativum]